MLYYWFFFCIQLRVKLIIVQTVEVVYSPTLLPPVTVLVTGLVQIAMVSNDVLNFVTRLTRLVPLVDQELLTLPEHLSSPSVFSEFHVTRSLVLFVCFVDRCLSFCTFSFGHCVFCSSIYGFWLPLWYLNTLHKTYVLL